MSETSAHPAEKDTHTELLLLLLNNLHVGVSNEDIVIEDYSIPAPAHLRVALVDLMDVVVDPADRRPLSGVDGWRTAADTSVIPPADGGTDE